MNAVVVIAYTNAADVVVIDVVVVIVVVATVGGERDSDSREISFFKVEHGKGEHKGHRAIQSEAIPTVTSDYLQKSFRVGQDNVKVSTNTCHMV